MKIMGFPGGSGVKNPAANAEDMGSIPGLGRSPGVGNGNPLQCSCLGNPMNRGAQGAIDPEVTRAGHNLVTKHHHPVKIILTLSFMGYSLIKSKAKATGTALCYLGSYEILNARTCPQYCKC